LQIGRQKGWSTVDQAKWGMHVPPDFPIGMDIYQMGTYTPKNGELTPEFAKKMRTKVRSVGQNG